MYRYYCPHRPPLFGDIPTNGLLEAVCYPEGAMVYEPEFVNAIHRDAWGHADYKAPLPDDVIARYELVPDPRNGGDFRG